jgi:hypothetical protein
VNPIGMSQEEISRTEYWKALSPEAKRILDIWFLEEERSLVEAAAIYFNRTLMTTPVVDERAKKAAEVLLKNPNVMAVVELRSGLHVSQQRGVIQ